MISKELHFAQYREESNIIAAASFLYHFHETQEFKAKANAIEVKEKKKSALLA